MFEHLPGYLQWANTRVLESLDELELPEALRWLRHVVAAEELWLARIQGREAGLEVWPEAMVHPELVAWISRNAEGYRAFLADGPDLSAWVAYTNSQGVDHRSRRRDILVHVIAHGAHHRGQIAAAVKRAGGVPAATDYVFYARGGS